MSRSTISIFLLGIFFCLGGALQSAVTLLIGYRARMRRQKFEALRQRIIGNRYFGKIKVGGRYFEK